MSRKYLFVLNSARGLFRGGALEDLERHVIIPMSNSRPVTAQNINIVPAWAAQASVPIPISNSAAQQLNSLGYSQNIIPLPFYPPQYQQEQPKQSLMNRVNFDALASIISKVVLDYLDGKARQNEPWYMKAVRYPTMAAETLMTNKAVGTPVNKENFIEKAAPVIGTIANSFLLGTGTAMQLGLKGLNWVKNKFFRKGKGGRMTRKSIFLFNDDTRRYLGRNLKKDIDLAADKAFKNKAEDRKWRKIIKEAFSSAIKTVAPAIGSGHLILGRKIKKSELKKMSKKKGGSMKDYMAWVCSFKKKKSGKGVKHRKSKGIRYINDGAGSGAGKRRRRRRGRHGGKLKIYKSRGIYYPKPVKKRRKHRRRSGKGLVSSGDLMKGTPYDYSGMPPYF